MIDEAIIDAADALSATTDMRMPSIARLQT